MIDYKFADFISLTAECYELGMLRDRRYAKQIKATPADIRTAAAFYGKVYTDYYNSSKGVGMPAWEKGDAIEKKMLSYYKRHYVA